MRGKNMPAKERVKTDYKGVYFYMSGIEKIYFIRYRRKSDGKQREDVLGTRPQWTPARAYDELLKRKAGIELSNNEKRLEKQQQNEAWTLKRLFEAYQNTLEPGRARGTDKTSFKRWQHLEDIEPCDLTTQDIEKLKKTLIKQGLSQESIRHTVNILNRVINYGIKTGLIKTPDSQRLYIEKVKVDQKLDIETMTDAELSRYLKALDEEKNQLSANAFRFALFTGMRKTAVLQLQWKDIDFTNNFIKLRGIVAKSGNTGAIKINELVKEILIFMKKHGNQGEYVFSKEDGQPYNDMKRMGRRLRNNAGLPENFRPFHGLRHTFASRAISSGVSLTDLQQLLTHKSPSMTQVYAHFSDEAMQKAADAAGNAMKIKEK